MPAPITYPALGVKHSETPTVSALGGDELVQAIRPLAADPTKFENVNIPAPFFGKGGASDGILYLPDGRVKLSPERQQQLADGKLFYTYDDGSGYRTQLQAKSFGVAPGNPADDNAKGVEDMRTYALGLPS